MTLDELIPAIDLLSRSEKIHLMQIVLQQLAQVETDPPASPAAEHFDPKQFYGIASVSSTSRNLLKGSVTFEEDILSPIGDDWEAV